VACLPAGPAQAELGRAAYDHGEQAGPCMGMLAQEKVGWPRWLGQTALWRAGHASAAPTSTEGGAGGAAHSDVGSG
jgi:hypothetical protein